MSGGDIAVLITASVGAITAAVGAIAAAIRYYRKAIREEGDRLFQMDRAEKYEEQSRKTIEQKDQEIAALRELAASWQRLAEQSQKPRTRRSKDTPS